MSKKEIKKIDLGEYMIEINHIKGKILEILVFDELNSLIESMEITNADE